MLSLLCLLFVCLRTNELITMVGLPHKVIEDNRFQSKVKWVNLLSPWPCCTFLSVSILQISRFLDFVSLFWNLQCSFNLLLCLSDLSHDNHLESKYQNLHLKNMKINVTVVHFLFVCLLGRTCWLCYNQLTCRGNWASNMCSTLND